MLLPPSSTKLRTHRSLNKDPPLRRPSRAACSASVSHLSAISMKRDLCSEVRAASANRMHSAALLRNWSKLGTSASICIDMGTDRVNRQRFVIPRSKFESAFGGPGLIFFNGLQKSIEAKAASNSGTISGSSVTNRANRNAVGERSGFVGAVSNQAK
jgi:hypothetical protein